jgi:hypothetical protein
MMKKHMGRPGNKFNFCLVVTFPEEPSLFPSLILGGAFMVMLAIAPFYLDIAFQCLVSYLNPQWQGVDARLPSRDTGCEIFPAVCQTGILRRFYACQAEDCRFADEREPQNVLCYGAQASY